MKFNFHFKKMEWSTELVHMVQERFQKLSHLELKPSVIRVTFSSERHEFQVHATVRGPDHFFTAKFGSGSFRDSLDRVIEKLETQMSKRKGKVQHHKNWTKSAEGRLSQMQEDFELPPKHRTRRAS